MNPTTAKDLRESLPFHKGEILSIDGLLNQNVKIKEYTRKEFRPRVNTVLDNFFRVQLRLYPLNRPPRPSSREGRESVGEGRRGGRTDLEETFRSNDHPPLLRFTEGLP